MAEINLNLRTSWETRAAAGEPSATIQVNNLQSIVSGPHDAWGRPSRPQPLSTSVEVSLAKPFSISSAGDAVGTDTVHYGLLSKEIQRILDIIAADPGPRTLTGVLEAIWQALTGFKLSGVEGPENETRSFLKAAALRYVKVTVHLPKASLLGSGISLTGSGHMAGRDGAPPKARAMALKFHDLRVPTLIGVNSNEREAEQIVVANVEVDKWMDTGHEDGISVLEQVITKAMKSSSFETLEALATELCVKIDEYLRLNYKVPDERGWRLKISLEKPIAVPLADAPCVELSTDSCDVRTSQGSQQ